MTVAPFKMVDESGSAVDLWAKWIAPTGPKPNNYTFLARKEFRLDRLPKRAILRVAADTRYVIYLNGKFVGAGPARGTHKRYFFDSYDVTQGLRKGKNHLAAEVHCPVKPLFNAAPVMPALFAQLEKIAGTDSTWEVMPDPSRRTDSLEYTFQMGYSEYRDLRKEPCGWRTFQDSAQPWAAAEEVAGAGSLDGRILNPRDILALTDCSYRPARVQETGCVPACAENVEDDLDYAGLMRGEIHSQAQRPKFENAEALTQGGSALILPSSYAVGAYCLLDFRRELCGSVIIDVEAPEGTILDVGYDEDASEGRLVTKTTVPVYRFADRYILRSGRQRIEHRLHDRGLRLIQLVFRRFLEPIKVHSVEVVNRIYPLPLEAAFECDQEFLNQLWRMSFNTLSMCCTDTFTDCPWREQSFWLNDQLVENLYYLCLTSDRIFPKRNLRIGADGQLPNGLIPAVYPSDRTTVFLSMQAIWTIVLSDYYLYTGDLEFVKEMLPVMDKALGFYDERREPDGLVPSQKDVADFIDWGYNEVEVDLAGKGAVHNLLIAAACKRASGLHAAAGNAGRANGLSRTSREVVAAVIRKFWQKKERRFYDCTKPRMGGKTFSQHPHAVAVHFGLLDEPYRSAALDAVLNPAALQAEPYFQHFALNALARNGRGDETLPIVRKLWGEMVRSGSPTIWESVHGRAFMSGCGSLCHGFACAPLHFMPTALLGIRPLKPGFREFALEPQSLGLLWARGQVPTPQGRICLEWKVREEGRLQAHIQIPEGTVARLSDGRELSAGESELELKTRPGKD